MRIWPVTGKLEAEGRATITGSDAKHLHDVLRCRPGEKLRVCDDAFHSFEGEVETVSRGGIALCRLQPVAISAHQLPEIVMAVSIGKPAVMELAVQKAVELGISRFIPVVTRHSLAEEISPAKLERLKKIAHEACKQCGRPSPMPVAEPTKLEVVPQAVLNIAFWEEERGRTLKEVLSGAGDAASVLFLVGSQSGLDKDEIELLKRRGFVSAGLGPLILRSETAAIAAASVIGYHFGRLG